jgi:hypothetical protein
MNYPLLLLFILMFTYGIVIFTYMGDSSGFCTSQDGFNYIYIPTVALGITCLILSSLIFYLKDSHITVSFITTLGIMVINFVIIILNLLVIFPKYGPLNYNDIVTASALATSTAAASAAAPSDTTLAAAAVDAANALSDANASANISAFTPNPITQCYLPRTLPIVIFTFLNCIIIFIFYRICIAVQIHPIE